MSLVRPNATIQLVEEELEHGAAWGEAIATRATPTALVAAP
jgi:hypothetical protein